MAWSNVTTNQMVSFTDAQTSGFSLNSGQSQVTSNQCMTKSEAFAKYNLTATDNTNGLASNQLIRKSFWLYVSFSNGRVLANESGSVSGTLTIIGEPVMFRAFATCFTVNSEVFTSITVNGIDRTAERLVQGTTNSTTFTLSAGTYSYSFTCDVTGTGSGGISFLQ